MKHYNKSEIMKRAWELNRTEDIPISEAMKKAWHEQRTFKEKRIQNRCIHQTSSI